MKLKLLRAAAVVCASHQKLLPEIPQLVANTFVLGQIGHSLQHQGVTEYQHLVEYGVFLEVLHHCTFLFLIPTGQMYSTMKKEKQINFSHCEGGLTCSFNDYQVAEFIQHRRRKVGKLPVEEYVGPQSDGSWVLGPSLFFSGQGTLYGQNIPGLAVCMRELESLDVKQHVLSSYLFRSVLSFGCIRGRETT